MMRKSLPLFCLAFFVLLTIALIIFKPHAEQRMSQAVPVMNVEVISLAAVDYRIEIASFGTVQPRTQSELLPQVSGQIMAVSPNFRDGGFFEKGEVLLAIDPRDYETQILIVESELADARLVLAEEEARADQAQKEWHRLGNQAQAPDLVLRKPQLMAAQARVKSVDAKLALARLGLDRTKIRAPFSGRVLTTNVDLGSVVPLSAQLATLYATDYVEIRLPIKNTDLNFIDLPEDYRFQPANGILPDVEIEDRSTLPAEVWPGKIVRTEGALDSFSHQLYVIAQIDDPYGHAANARRPLKIGQYINARIVGKMVRNVIVIPNAAIYQGSYVYIVYEGVLQRRNISIAWQNNKEALIAKGLDAGEQLVLTSLGQISSGTRVSIASEKLDTPSQQQVQGGR